MGNLLSLRKTGVSSSVLGVFCAVIACSAHAVTVSTVEELTSAITAVNNGGADTTITVANGFYDLSGVKMDPDGHLLITKPLTLQGADATSWREMPGATNRVIFDFGDVDRGIYIKKDVKKPLIRHITFQNGHAHDTRETTTAGYADNYSRGGAVTHGIASSSASGGDRLTVTNCVFRNCQARQGGGVYATIVRDCFFTNNVTISDGGAVVAVDIYNSLLIGNKSNASGGAVRNGTWVSNCVFVANSATAEGGGAFGAGFFYSCYFTNNVSGNKGGAICGEKASHTLRAVDCTFVGNKTGSFGGACSQVNTITNCVFEENVARYGGAIYWATNAVRACVFRRNRAEKTSAGGQGGAVYQANLFNNLFEENEADAGGACYNPINVVGCTFVGNVATNSGGGAIYGSKTTTYVEGCVFSNNWSKSTNWGNGGGGCNSVAFITNCLFVLNKVGPDGPGLNGYGGGVHLCTNVVDCVFDTCYASKGAAGCNSDLHYCLITNCLQAQSWGDASIVGVRGYAADPTCRIDHSRIVGCGGVGVGLGVSRALCRVVASDCEIEGGISQSRVTRCTLFGVKETDFDQSDFTNCLFNGCVENASRRTSSNSYFFNACTNVVNCTVVNCTTPPTMIAGVGAYVNTIFWNNTNNTTACDLKQSGVATFTNCLYKTTGTTTMKGTGNIVLKGMQTPSFLGAEDPDHPYGLAYSSKARNAGVSIAALASEVDLAGNPRVNETLDIGAYECWGLPRGTMVIFR